MQLTIDNVSKQYSGGNWGLRGLSLSVEPGVLGLIGPNGAGKSTLMRILATISQPTNGAVRWDDIDVAANPEAVRRSLGYLPQDFGVYPNLNAVEFLAYVAALKGMAARAARKRIDELLLMLNLADARKRPLGGYSGGMKQRVGIAQALLNDPKLLIVDEPTVGLDPEERVRFRHLLSEFASNRIVLLSTHIVSDVESTASRIAVIAGGKLIIATTPEAIVDSVRGQVWELPVDNEQLAKLRQSQVVSGIQRRGGELIARVVAKTSPANKAVSVTPSLEDAYLSLVNAQRAAA
jgi:ABC-type multidrug transport system ATPase subunit